MIILTFIGCHNSRSNDKGVELIYAPTVRWNNINYNIDPNTVIAKEHIGKQLGTIKKIVKKFPIENCQANDNIKVGTKIYIIKKENIADAIAIKFNGKYLKAVGTNHIK